MKGERPISAIAEYNMFDYNRPDKGPGSVMERIDS